MKQFIYLSVFCVFAFAACTSPYKKGDSGLEYKVIEDGSGKKLAYGNFLQMHITQRYKDAKKDTLLGDSRDYMPRIEAFDSNSTPPAYLKILGNTRKGDSLVIRILADSVYKQSPTEMPSFIKKGGYLYTTVKIINIFTSKEQADSANTAEMKTAKPKIYKKQLEKVEKDIATNKAQIEADSKVISAYLEKNNIKTIKGNWGTFIAIHTEGTGAKMDNNSVATVNYTGKTLDSGKVFDSNLDPKFNHMEPLQVYVGQLGSMILGWPDAFMQLTKGTKATIYIPSSLGYGKNGNPPKIGPDANLVFDVDIIDVSTEEQATAKAEAMKKKNEDMQRRMLDSLQNANKAKANK